MHDDSCESIAELLVDYADGELPAAGRSRVAEHLAGYPESLAATERIAEIC